MGNVPHKNVVETSDDTGDIVLVITQARCRYAYGVPSLDEWLKHILPTNNISETR